MQWTWKAIADSFYISTWRCVVVIEHSSIDIGRAYIDWTEFNIKMLQQHTAFFFLCLHKFRFIQQYALRGSKLHIAFLSRALQLESGQAPTPHWKHSAMCFATLILRSQQQVIGARQDLLEPFGHRQIRLDSWVCVIYLLYMLYASGRIPNIITWDSLKCLVSRHYLFLLS